MPNEPERTDLETDLKQLPERSALAMAALCAGRSVRLAAAFALAVILSDCPALARESKAGTFDYYALSLSWSPTYCGSDAGNGDDQQCGKGRAYAFVVHGLWPQFERGWPEFCESRETWVPNQLIQGMLAIMPSKALIIHEWKKHGTCSGLTIAKYFDTVRNLFGKARIPARYLFPRAEINTSPKQITQDFVKTNLGLTSDMISIQCGNNRDRARLQEVRICFDRKGAFRSCGKNEANRCRATMLILPPVRN
ncbi:ribonuclease T2 [soil metagenome]